MRASLLLVLLLAACTPRVEIREVKVPVAVRAEPPPELVNCTARLQIPVFKACGPDACLSPVEQARFRTFVHTLLSCDSGWRAWSQPAP